MLIGGGNSGRLRGELPKLLGDRLTIIDHIPQPLLASAFAASAVHVLPSWMETCGLVTLEAPSPVPRGGQQLRP